MVVFVFVVVFVVEVVRNAFVCDWEYLHPAQLKTLVKSSQLSSFLSHLVRLIRTIRIICTTRTIHRIFCGLRVLSSMKSSPSRSRSRRTLAVCKVVIHLVYANANLFHFEKVDQLR